MTAFIAYQARPVHRLLHTMQSITPFWEMPITPFSLGWGRLFYVRLSAESFQTQCLTTQQDNDLWPYLGSECIVATAQDFVSDGCYVPKSKNVLTDGPSTSTLALPVFSLSAQPSSPTQSLHVITPTLTTFIEPTIAIIVTNGVTQTIVVAPFNANASGSNQTKSIFLLCSPSLP